MKDIHSPRQYFLQVLLPAYEELGETLMDGVLGGRRDLIALGRAAEACLHLADHIARDPEFGRSILGSPKSKKYIKDLGERYRHFSIARDVANSFKHRQISDVERRIDGIESLEERLALIRYTDQQGHYWVARKTVIIRLNSGEEILAEETIRQCIDNWIQELIALGIISSPPSIQNLPKRFLSRLEVPDRPRISMRAQRGEYFSSGKVLILQYDPEKDAFQFMREKIGSIEYDVNIIESPSPFTTQKGTTESLVTLTVSDSLKDEPSR